MEMLCHILHSPEIHKRKLLQFNGGEPLQNTVPNNGWPPLVNNTSGGVGKAATVAFPSAPSVVWPGAVQITCEVVFRRYRCERKTYFSTGPIGFNTYPETSVTWPPNSQGRSGRAKSNMLNSQPK